MFYHYYLRQEKKKARKSAEDIIQQCKTIISDNTGSSDGVFKERIRVIAILFRGLLDLLDVSVMKKSGWLKNNELVEKIWVRMIDSEDRLEYAKSYCRSLIGDDLLKSVYDLEKEFFDNFGHGYYASTELKIEHTLCSICGQDFRSCAHVSGDIYDGVMCQQKVDGVSLSSVSLVRNPADRRCRVWPWQVNQGGSSTINAMTLFRIDDFLD
jgi:hypothetical protein